MKINGDARPDLSGTPVTSWEISRSYCTLYKVGTGAWLDAVHRTNRERRDDGTTILVHSIGLAVVGWLLRDVVQLGNRSFEQHDADDPTVVDGDGKAFPNLEAAIQAYAADAVTITATPGPWTSEPSKHQFWGGSAE